MKYEKKAVGLVLCMLILVVHAASSQKKWEKGAGWGWVWGPNDELGALNEITEKSVLDAVRLVRKGAVRDLGVLYDRNSYQWDGHVSGEVITFRSPVGTRHTVGGFEEDEVRTSTTSHTCAIFISDNVATQIDGLGHVVSNPKENWYNGYTEEEWGGNHGIRKASADKIPPILARGILIDVASYKRVDALPGRYVITPDDLDGALKRQGTRLQFGDVVLIRTGTLRYWGENGSNTAKIGEHDSAGIQLPAAKWLVEEHGAILIGSDTSGLEMMLPQPPTNDFMPVHHYLLIEQGVYIGEFHYLEDLAAEKVYEFLYIVASNKIKGVTGGSALKPIAVY